MARKANSDQLLIQNAAKTLLANIRFASVDNPIRSLLMTSSVPNEGKSTVAVNLAQAAATSGMRVLLVECDMRRRMLANLIGVHAQSGIYAVLSGQVPLDQAVVATPTNGMYLLDSEPHIPNPADIVSSKRFKHLLATMEDAYDLVILDTPPVGTFVDAAVILALADGAALVVREKFTPRAEVQKAYEQLQKAGAHVIGAVMNFCEAESSEYYYEYYTKDGKRAKKDASSAPVERAAGNAMPQRRGAQSPASALQSGSRFKR